MEKSKKLARANWKGSGDKSLLKKSGLKLENNLILLNFWDMNLIKLEGVVLKISKDKEFVE